MSIRLLLQGGGASPMRVLASGANPATAQFGDLLFDANYRAMRLGQITVMNSTGSVSVPLFKTFPTPPLAVGMISLQPPTGGSTKRPPTILMQIPGGPFTTRQGTGFGTTTADVFMNNYWPPATIVAVQVAVLVFDLPM